MSRYRKFRSFLSFSEAWPLYWRFKTGKLENISLSRLKHPFSLRKNPYDYYTFLEVVLQEAYSLKKDFSPRTIIDGGGNIGLTAAYFASRYPEAQIVSVEPDADNFRMLEKNTEAYGNVKAMQGGIWVHPAWLRVRDTGIGNNGFTVEEVPESTTGAIKAWSIASLMKEMKWNSIDLVKLDVEGSEKEIFSEAYEQWLPHTKVLVVELHDRMKKGCSRSLFNAIGQYRFTLEIAGENLVFYNEELS